MLLDNNMPLKETEQLGNALNRELTRIGKNSEEFIVIANKKLGRN